MWSCSSVEYRQLTASVCGRVLSQYSPTDPEQTPQLSDMATNKSHETAGKIVRVATVARCGLDTTEKELLLLLRLRLVASPTCAAAFPSLLCRYFYRSCEGHLPATPRSSVSSDECRSLKEGACRSEWSLLQRYVDTGDICLTLPDCGSLIKVANQSNDQSRTVSRAHGVVDNFSIIEQSVGIVGCMV